MHQRPHCRRRRLLRSRRFHCRRLLGEHLEDGGWNCERARGSVRSSFPTTINVLEGLLEYEKATDGTPETRKARSVWKVVPAGAQPLSASGHGKACGRPVPVFPSPQPLALRHTARAGLFPLPRPVYSCRPIRGLPRPLITSAPSSLADGTWLLDWTPKGPHLVRGRRRRRSFHFEVADPARAPGAPVVGSLTGEPVAARCT